MISRAVLEHIHPHLVQAVFRSVRALLKDGWHMCHVIDNSDHWEHHDKSISRINFLRYSDRMWRLMSLNGQSCQNRLRHSEYRLLISDAGFVIGTEMGEVDLDCIEALKQLPVSERFRTSSPEDLAIHDVSFRRGRHRRLSVQHVRDPGRTRAPAETAVIWPLNLATSADSCFHYIPGLYNTHPRLFGDNQDLTCQHSYV